MAVHSQKEILVVQISKESREIIHLLFELLFISLDSAFTEDFIRVLGQQFRHWKFTNINVEEVLKTQLKLSVEKSVARKTLINDASIMS